MRTPLNPDTDVEMTDVSNSANPSQDIPSLIHPLQDDVIDLGTSLFGRKRQPSRRLLESAAAAFLMNITDSNNDPQSYQEALSGPDKTEWRISMDKEHSQLIENGTWMLVPREQVPKGSRIIQCK